MSNCSVKFPRACNFGRQFHQLYVFFLFRMRVTWTNLAVAVVFIATVAARRRPGGSKVLNVQCVNSQGCIQGGCFYPVASQPGSGPKICRFGSDSDICSTDYDCEDGKWCKYPSTSSSYDHNEDKKYCIRKRVRGR